MIRAALENPNGPGSPEHPGAAWPVGVDQGRKLRYLESRCIDGPFRFLVTDETGAIVETSKWRTSIVGVMRDWKERCAKG